MKPVRTARYEGRGPQRSSNTKANRSGTGAGWKPRGRGNSVGIVRSAFRHHGNRASARRSFEARWCRQRHGVRALGFPSIFARRAAPEVKSPAIFSAATEQKQLAGLMSGGHRCNSGPRDHSGQVCKRPKQRGCKPRPFGVRTFESMPCPPCDRSSKAEPHVANVKTPDRYRPVAPVRPVSKSGDCPGLKNRRGRIETGAGHHFGPLVITGARRSCKPEDGFRLPDGPPRSE